MIGLEPITSCLQSMRSANWNYTPFKEKNIEIKLSEEMGFEPMVHFIAR